MQKDDTKRGEDLRNKFIESIVRPRQAWLNARSQLEMAKADYEHAKNKLRLNRNWFLENEVPEDDDQADEFWQNFDELISGGGLGRPREWPGGLPTNIMDSVAYVGESIRAACKKALSDSEAGYTTEA